MTERTDSIVLDLRTLPDKVDELERAHLETRASAATVVIEHLQGSGDRTRCHVRASDQLRDGTLIGVDIDDRSRRTHADLQIATEKGAEGVALLTAHDVLGRIVFARLPKGTGADYKMRDPRASSDDGYERLECSGIGVGDESTASRLKKKIAQLDRAKRQPPGYAIVTNFHEPTIEIVVARLAR